MFISKSGHHFLFNITYLLNKFDIIQNTLCTQPYDVSYEGNNNLITTTFQVDGENSNQSKNKSADCKITSAAGD